MAPVLRILSKPCGLGLLLFAVSGLNLMAIPGEAFFTELWQKIKTRASGPGSASQPTASRAITAPLAIPGSASQPRQQSAGSLSPRTAPLAIPGSASQPSGSSPQFYTPESGIIWRSPSLRSQRFTPPSESSSQRNTPPGNTPPSPGSLSPQFYTLPASTPPRNTPPFPGSLSPRSQRNTPPTSRGVIKRAWPTTPEKTEETLGDL